MSIPPLVCSTPPPIEQCDDDRDGEDFDIQYNLSQDDEDDGHNYNYGTYSDYIYPTSTSSNIHQDIWSPNISKKTDDKLSSDLLEEKKDTVSVLPENDSSSVNKIEIEDTVLEDLNLKLEDQNDMAALEQNVNKYDTETFGVDCSKDLSKQHANIIDKNEDGIQFTVTEDFNETTVVNNITSLETNEEPIIEGTVEGEYPQENFHVNPNESNTTEKEMGDETLSKMTCDNTKSTESSIPVIDQKDVIASDLKLEDLSDDDFGEFDDFQFKSPETSSSIAITYCDNPWKSEVSKNSDFGNFTATFDVDVNNLCKSNDSLDENNADKNNKAHLPTNESDDFGDFDDFKSSTNDYRETSLIYDESAQNVPVLSLSSPDSEIQIIESINSVLSSIFTSEILELEDGFEGKLESSLNETWGHLVDTDVRQSYIVNWNNSLGQKSLLKALCIDSRNILFGPKWNYSMPKFAANLTVAPLQPQKPVTPINTKNLDDQNVDKTTNKESTTWTDPFTTDGKESCNSETESTATVTRPANLDVFTNVISHDIGHVYSSNLTVQPIRQINLPDTHIFTPTDSETPRSKTIHYDQAPAVIVPQSSESNQQLDELHSKSKSEVSLQNPENDEDYWEFQDFKSGNDISNKNVTSSVNHVMNTTSTNICNVSPVISTYETQILQPIKVEPMTPTLNWPDPGEVKETFDDFSEFISNTSWSNEKTNSGNQLDSRLDCKLESENEIIEDDFETFQSAPTVRNTINHQNFTNLPPHFDTSDKSHTAMSKTDDTIISKQSMDQNESSVPTIDNFTLVKDSNEKSSPVLSLRTQSITTTIMHPSIANTNASQRNHHKTGQILQPLSLESYSQINWPSPGIDLQDLSRFNPVESLQSLKTDLSTGASSKLASPAHKDINTTRNEISDEDIWGDFVSSKPKQQQMQPKKVAVFADDDEWTEFVSSPSVKPQNGLNTISLNVHTNLNMQKTLGQNKFQTKNNQLSLDIPTLKYVTPKSSSHGLYNEKHFQNL